MKVLGIIGGIGPESTVDYYQSIVSLYRERTGGRYPRIIINSIDLEKIVALVTSGRWEELSSHLEDELRRLVAAGATLALLAANTPHIVFEETRQRSPIPLISIVEEACKAAKSMRLETLGIFGTRFTMQGRFYPDVFLREGLKIVAPELDEQDYIHEKYMTELITGTFLGPTREGLLRIADRLIDKEHIDGLILAGTELPLILREESHRGIPLLNTTRIHARAAVESLL